MPPERKCWHLCGLWANSVHIFLEDLSRCKQTTVRCGVSTHSKILEGQVARWLESLAENDLKVQHRPGKKHTNADALSRLPGQLVDVNVSSTTSVPNSNWLPCLAESQIRELQDTDEDIKQKQVIDSVEHPNARPNKCPPSASHVLKSLWAQKKYLEVKRRVLYRQWEDAGGGGVNKCLQLVIPPSRVPSVLSELHDSLSGGHLIVGKVLEKVRARFYWVGQYHDVEEWCGSCNLCGSTKAPPKQRHAPLQIPQQQPMDHVAMVILGPLSITPRQNKYVLVVGDYFTKWTEAFPTPDMETATIARVLVNEFISRFGAPSHLHTDQGRSFELSLIKEICRLMWSVKTRTTPYHPQSDGMIEWFNRTLLSMLTMDAVDDETNWDLRIPCLMLAYRTGIHEATKHTPFSLMFGREVQLPTDVILQVQNSQPMCHCLLKT